MNHIEFFKKKGWNPSYTSNEVGIRIVHKEIFIWYPNTGTLMNRTNVGQKKLGVTKDPDTVAKIIEGYVGR